MKDVDKKRVIKNVEFLLDVNEHILNNKSTIAIICYKEDLNNVKLTQLSKETIGSPIIEKLKQTYIDYVIYVDYDKNSKPVKIYNSYEEEIHITPVPNTEY